MTAHASAYNGVEVDGKGDLEKVDVTASKERGENDGDRVGGSFVIVTCDSGDIPEKDLDLHVNGEIIASSLEENGVQKSNVGSISGEVVVRDHVATQRNVVEVGLEHDSANGPVHVEGDGENSENHFGETTASVVEEKLGSDKGTVVEESEKNYEEGAKNRELLEKQSEEMKEECHEEVKGNLDENGAAGTTDCVDGKRIKPDSIVDLGENKEADTKFAVEVEGKKENPEKETDHEMEVESIVKVIQEPESVVDHQVETKSADEVEDRWGDNMPSETGHGPGPEPVQQENFTAFEKIVDQAGIEQEIVAKGKPEPCTISAELKKHEKSASVAVHIEEKHEPQTLQAETGDQGGLDSPVVGRAIVVEGKPESCILLANPEKHKGAVHIEGKHEPCTLETETREQEELDSSVVGGAIVVEGKPESCTLFANLEKHEESEPEAVHIEEKHEPCTLETEIAEPGGLNSSVIGGEILVEGKPEPCNLFANLEKEKESEPGAFDIKEKHEPCTLATEIGKQDGSDSSVVGREIVVEGKPDTSTMSAKPEKHEESVRVAIHKHEPNTLETKVGDQGGLDSCVEVESQQESDTEVAETVDQAHLQTASEVVEMQEPELAGLESPQSEALTVSQEESMFIDVANDATPDRCSDEYATVLELRIRNHQDAGEDTESSHGYGPSSICTAKEAISHSHSMETAEVNKSVDHVKDLQLGNSVSIGPSEISSSLNASQISQEELIKEVTENIDDMKVLEFSNNCTGCSEGPLQTDSEAPYTAGEPCEDVNSDIVSASIRNSVEVEFGCTPTVETACVGANSDTEREISDCENNVETNIGYVFHNIPAVNLDSMVHNGFLQFGKFTVAAIECDEPINKDDDEEQLLHQEAEAIDDVHAISGYPNASNLDEDMVGAQFWRRQPCYIIKVPRFSNDDLWASIQYAQLQLDEKTQSRDSLQVAIQKEQVACADYRKNLEAAKADERATRATYNAKRQDLSSIQSIINKLNKATSIKEIDEMIVMKERSLQHETLSLKQEKLYIQEIKELKARRKQLSTTMGSKEKIEEAFDQKDQIYERLRTLKKELDILGSKLTRAEEKTNVAQKDYSDEQKIRRDLQEQFKSAHEVRQEAYVHWRNLKNESIKRSKYFFRYKDDQDTAANFISSGNRKGLWLHCNRQVERMLEIWNKDEEFRKQYIESNKNSTLRRFGTLDGRSLGPDEDPPVLNSNRKLFSPLPLSVVNPHISTVASEVKPEIVSTLAPRADKDIFPILQAAQTSQPAKSRKSANSTLKETITVKVPYREEIDETGKEETNDKEQTVRKAEELVRREEELREKSAAEKEQCRLEQRAKAKEAEERKKKKAEKAQERAEYKARKEAELRDKKRAKKEKKKAAAIVDSLNGGDESDSAPTDSSAPEIAPDFDVSVGTSSKRPSRRGGAMKQHYWTQPVPLPLRNRGKRKIRPWMWVVLSILLVLALFLVSSNFSSLSFNRTHFGI
ncbi:uncharacterized protein [Typha latifolia]|uniref:uncharacterized protein n=1 Tax=Typha latifolia TaxID=4733 RepID=UPI003C2AC0CA